MKIAFVMYPGACFLGKVDGTKMQSIIWKEAESDRHLRVLCSSCEQEQVT